GPAGRSADAAGRRRRGRQGAAGLRAGAVRLAADAGRHQGAVARSNRRPRQRLAARARGLRAASRRAARSVETAARAARRGSTQVLLPVARAARRPSNQALLPAARAARRPSNLARALSSLRGEMQRPRPDLASELERLQLDILPQPDDFTCGPTCLHAIYRYLGDEVPLDK